MVTTKKEEKHKMARQEEEELASIKKPGEVEQVTKEEFERSIL